MNTPEDQTWTSEVPDTSGMTTPVRCTHENCGKVYDLATVTKTRVGASSGWIAPCCDRPANDRGETASAWKSMEHYVRLDQS